MSTPQSIQEQLQSLEPSAIIELFELELTEAINGINQTYYYRLDRDWETPEQKLP